MHYETLSLFQNPTAYLAWFLNRGALVLAAIVGFKFFRATRRTVWLLLAAAFLLLLALTAIDPLRHGLSLLPYAEVSDPVNLPPSTNGMTFSRTVFSRTFIPWDATSYVLAIALCLAWRQYERDNKA